MYIVAILHGQGYRESGIVWRATEPSQRAQEESEHSSSDLTMNNLLSNTKKKISEAEQRMARSCERQGVSRHQLASSEASASDSKSPLLLLVTFFTCYIFSLIMELGFITRCIQKNFGPGPERVKKDK